MPAKKGPFEQMQELLADDMAAVNDTIRTRMASAILC